MANNMPNMLIVSGFFFPFLERFLGQPPQNLQMESYNFQHILSWQAKSDPIMPTYYRVLYSDRRQVIFYDTIFNFNVYQLKILRLEEGLFVWFSTQKCFLLSPWHLLFYTRKHRLFWSSFNLSWFTGTGRRLNNVQILHNSPVVWQMILNMWTLSILHWFRAL